MVHSPVVCVCAVAITAGLASHRVQAKTADVRIMSHPTWHAPAAAQPGAPGGAGIPLQQQLLWTDMGSSSSRGHECRATSAPPLKGSVCGNIGSLQASSPETPCTLKRDVMWVRGGATDGGTPNTPGANEAVKPGSPSKVAEAKGKADSGAKGGGVWGSVARGSAAAWRAVRGGRPRASGGGDANGGATSAGDAVASRRSSSGSDGPKSGNGGASASGGTKEGWRSTQTGGPGLSSSSSSPFLSGSDSGAAAQSSSSGGSAAGDNNNRRGAAYSGSSSSKKRSVGGGGERYGAGHHQRQKQRTPSSSTNNIYGAAAAGWQAQQQRKPPGSFMVSAAERERREVELRDGIKRTENDLGKEHPKVATLLFLLSRVVQERGAYDEAEELCTRALNIYEAALGPEHPDVGVALNCLAMSWQAQVCARGTSKRLPAVGSAYGSFSTALLCLRFPPFYSRILPFLFPPFVVLGWRFSFGSDAQDFGGLLLA